MGCCFQSFGIDCDASYTHYFHQPNCTKRSLWQGIKSSASWAAHTQRIGLAACSPSLCSHTAVLLPRQHHTQGLISAVLAAKQYPKCGAGLEGYQCLLQHNPSSAWLFLIIMHGRCAGFWQRLAQCFQLLQIDWGKQVPLAEQLPRHVPQQK